MNYNISLPKNSDFYVLTFVIELSGGILSHVLTVAIARNEQHAIDLLKIQRPELSYAKSILCQPFHPTIDPLLS